MSGYTRPIHQLSSWMSGVLSLLLTLQSTVVHLRLWKQIVVNRLKWGRAPGICGIHAELLKAIGNAVLMLLHAVLCSAWSTSIIPTDCKRSLVVPLWKGKSDCQDCNNYQGVTLLSVMGKVFARIIIDRVHHHLFEHSLPEQSGFTPKRSTIDRILAVWVLTECRREFR